MEPVHRRSVLLVLALTAVAPALWGTTYFVTTEWLPPDRPLLAGTLRALPAGLLLMVATRSLPGSSSSDEHGVKARAVGRRLQLVNGSRAALLGHGSDL